MGNPVSSPLLTASFSELRACLCEPFLFCRIASARPSLALPMDHSCSRLTVKSQLNVKKRQLLIRINTSLYDQF